MKPTGCPPAWLGAIVALAVGSITAWAIGRVEPPIVTSDRTAEVVAAWREARHERASEIESELLAGTRGPVPHDKLFDRDGEGCVVVELSIGGWIYCADVECDGWPDEDPAAQSAEQEFVCRPLVCESTDCGGIFDLRPEVTP